MDRIAKFQFYVAAARGLTLARLAAIPVFVTLLLWVERPGEKAWGIALLGLYLFVVLSDWLDGVLARRGGGTSRFWGIIDAAIDIAFNSLSLLAAAWIGRVGFWVPVGVAILGGQFLVRNLRRLPAQGDGLHEDSMGKTAGVLAYILVGIVVLDLSFHRPLGPWIVGRAGDALFIYVLALLLLKVRRLPDRPVP